MRFVVGIGNPGTRYEGTRHNVGFAVLDRLFAERAPGARWDVQRDLNALCGRAAEAWLVKPQTFVNVTGETVRALRRRHPDLSPADLLVVSDDVNLDFGKLRIRPSGSAGGHHGLESVIEALGSEEFPRLRVGVRTADMPKELSGYVLGPFDAEEGRALGAIVERAAAVCGTWIEDGFRAAETRLARLQS